LRAEKKSLEEYAALQQKETEVAFARFKSTRNWSLFPQGLTCFKQMNNEMAPYKKQNAMLMNIVSAAEKGHNMLLTTMSSINKEISSGL